MLYRIIDRQTGKQVGKDHTSGKRARTRRDALDTAYGACRYTVQFIDQPECPDCEGSGCVECDGPNHQSA